MVSTGCHYNQYLKTIINHIERLECAKVTYKYREISFFEKCAPYVLGAYVPLTGDGNIAIGGMLGSCYALFGHDLSHFAMTPMQWYPDIIK